MNVLFNMASLYSVTEEERDVYHEALGHMLQNAYRIQNMTCNELADLCFVAPSTIIRLCKKLGYSSYTAFRTDLKNSLSSFHYFNDFFPPNIKVPDYLNYIARMLEQVRETIDEDLLDKIARAMHEHEEVTFFCGGNSLTSQFFQLCLFLGGQHTEFYARLKDLDRAVERIPDNSFIVVTREDNAAAVDTDRIMKEARKKNASILLITNTASESVSSKADYVLSFPGEHISILDNMGLDLLQGCLLMKYKELYVDSLDNYL